METMIMKATTSTTKKGGGFDIDGSNGALAGAAQRRQWQQQQWGRRQHGKDGPAAVARWVAKRQHGGCGRIASVLRGGGGGGDGGGSID